MARWGMPSPQFALKGRNSDPGVTNAPPWRTCRCSKVARRISQGAREIADRLGSFCDAVTHDTAICVDCVGDHRAGGGIDGVIGVRRFARRLRQCSQFRLLRLPHVVSRHRRAHIRWASDWVIDLDIRAPGLCLVDALWRSTFARKARRNVSDTIA